MPQFAGSVHQYCSTLHTETKERRGADWTVTCRIRRNANLHVRYAASLRGYSTTTRAHARARCLWYVKLERTPLDSLFACPNLKIRECAGSRHARSRALYRGNGRAAQRDDVHEYTATTVKSMHYTRHRYYRHTRTYYVSPAHAT